MSYSTSKPQFRHTLRVQTLHHEGKDFLVISCLYNLIKDPIVLSKDVVPILRLLTGELTIDDIAKSCNLELTEVSNFISYLDENFCLENRNFDARVEQQKTNFLLDISRPSLLTGGVFPKSSVELFNLLDTYYQSAKSFSNPTREDLFVPTATDIVAPHIDYNRGGSGYALAYSVINPAPKDLFVILGINHQYSNSLFTVTGKDFVTPFGIVPTNTSLYNKLSQASLEFIRDEWLHLHEHSIEIQLPFIQKKFVNFEILPIMVGSFDRYLYQGLLPENDDVFKYLIGNICECLSSYQGGLNALSFILSVDMSHLGYDFGDAFLITDEVKASTESADLTYLEAICNGDRISIFHQLAEDKNARRICGFPAIYTFMYLAEAINLKVSFKLLQYSQAINSSKSCCVTYSSMRIDRKSYAEN
jgi:MEMO1 family protein